jgi:uncharacterized protein with PIN domain
MAGTAEEKEIRFFADCMLGRLARWLRALGFDTKYERAIEDDELLRRCREEGRVLLTRDTGMARGNRGTKLLLVDSENAGEQLRGVMRYFGLEYREERLFSRCTHCNREVIEVPKEEVEGRVPPYVFSTERRFTYCSSCDKLFWRGTHRKRFLEHVIHGGGR